MNPGTAGILIENIPTYFTWNHLAHYFNYFFIGFYDSNFILKARQIQKKKKKRDKKSKKKKMKMKKKWKDSVQKNKNKLLLIEKQEKSRY